MRDRRNALPMAAVMAANLALLVVVSLVSGSRPANAADGIWTTVAPSGYARQEATYVEANGRMYLTAWKNNLQKAYDPATDRWSTVAPLPAPQLLDHIQVAAVNGKVFYVGGFRTWPSDTVGSVYVYDTATDTFTTGTPLPAARDRGAGGIAAANGKIYLAGGVHDGTTVPWFDVYDPATDSWSTLPDLPHARNHFQAVVAAGRFWAIGGRSTPSAATAVGFNEAFDFASGRWTSGLAPLPTLRSGTATAVLGQEIAVIGGEGSGIAFDDVEAYDIASNTWRALTPMPTARHGTMAATWNGAAYIANGGTQQGGGSGTDVQERLTLAGTTPPRPDAMIRLASQTAFVGNDVYNTTGAQQTRATTTPPGQRRTFVVRLQNDGPSEDGFTVRGCSAGTGFRVRYLAGTTGSTDISTAVVAGTYTVGGVPKGGTSTLRLEVTPTAGTSRGAVQSCLVRVTSTIDSTTGDAVLARVTVS